MEILAQSPVKFNAGAVKEIMRLLEEANFPSSHVLRVGVKGGGCSGLTYVLGFDERKSSDQEYNYEGISFVMDNAHELYLLGMEIDWNDGLSNRGFTFTNPNASTTCGCGTSFAV
ncbi:MAG: HesB/IscA family protein [Chitinophagaceae bacterium]